MTATTTAPRISYRTMRASAHLSGGQTMTEAVATYSDGQLRGMTAGALGSVLRGLDREFAAVTTDRDYDEVAPQRRRVREALIAKGAM